MCFKLKSKRAKVAKKNIICYKASDLRRESKAVVSFRPYFVSSFKYLLNKKTKKVILSVNCNETILEGYHSIKSKDNWWLERRAENYKIGKFIIPKGTRYYENYEEYVSETLIFKGYIK